MTFVVPTLLSLSGASLEPAPLERAALVVIDAQMEYVTGRLPLSGIDRALEEIAALLDLARSRDVPVVHVIHVSAPGRALFEPSGPAIAIAPQATPRSGEAVVRKALPNSFAGTDLALRLKQTGRSELILAGFMTHNCIYATAMSGLDHGYRNMIVAAATATRDLPGVPAALVQQAALAGLSDRAALVIANAASLSG